GEVDLDTALLAAGHIDEGDLVELSVEVFLVLDELGGGLEGDVDDGLVGLETAGPSGPSGASAPPGASRAAGPRLAGRIADAVPDDVDVGAALSLRAVRIGLAEVRRGPYAVRADEAQQGPGAKPGERGAPHAGPTTPTRDE